jgi:hypothetical protein
VEGVACILDERHEVPREERNIVETGDRLVPLVEERELAAVGRGALLLDELEDRRPPACAAGAGRRIAVLRARCVGVPGLVEVELRELRAGPELAVLRSLERCACSLASVRRTDVPDSWRIVSQCVVNDAPWCQYNLIGSVDAACDSNVTG